MSFTFSLDNVTISGEPVYYGEEFYFAQNGRQVKIGEATVSVCLTRHSDKVRIANIAYRVPGIEAILSAEVAESGLTKLALNGRTLPTSAEGFRLHAIGNSLLPEFRYLRERATSPLRTVTYPAVSPLYPVLYRILRANIESRVSDRSVEQLAARFVSMGPPTDVQLIDLAKGQGVLIGRAIKQVVDSRNETYADLVDILFAMWFPSLSKSVGVQLRAIFGATLYIGPARARSERYYRYQELAVSEIDPDGKNFPMFLNSLSTRQMSDFSSWTEKLFGYGVNVSKQSGHISINLVSEGRETNIVDVGYGVSQILPVLGQIWWAKARPISRAERSTLSLLAIEQPELHLHPAHQALLADALVGEATTATAPATRMHYVVETHSETLVNRFGEFIAAGRIGPEDVQVVMFDAEDEGTTRVRTVNYDKDGILVDWPYGFFQPSMLE